MSVAEINVKISLKRYYNQTLAIQINIFLELMCILKSCCLHVLLSPVFSFLNRRGKVYEADPHILGTIRHVPMRPYFKCDAAILLLQHGIDPNLYRLRDVWFQFFRHSGFNLSGGCVSSDAMLKTFLGAGYHITLDDRNDLFMYEKELRHYDINIDEPLSLKQLCRSQIRTQLRTVLNDTTIFPSIEQLPIPSLLKTFLKLHDIIDLNNSSINCSIPH